MELTVKELRESVYNYLEKTIKKTPKEFQNLIEAIIMFKEKCGIGLAIYTCFEFNPWGDFHGMATRIGQGFIGEGDLILLNLYDFDHFLKEDIRYFISDYLEKEYPIFDEDNDDYDEKLAEDLYEELYRAFKKDEQFKKYKKDYLCMLAAERAKERIEDILEESEYADKDDNIHSVRLYNKNKKLIAFGVNYRID